MPKIFFDIKRRDYLALGASPGKIEPSSLAYPSCFFLSTLPKALTNINLTYKDVPFIQEKLKTLKKLIRIDQDTIATWEASEPGYLLLSRVKEQLARNEKLLKEITGAQPCQ